ncbi:hypothetical protein STPL106120_04095 [Streptococcus pluranimalium]
MKKVTNNQSIFNKQSLIPTNELKQITGGDGFSFWENLFPPKKTNKIG